MKTLKRNCPHCQSEKTAPIPQTSVARLIGYLVPRRPYLCLDCRKRFNQYENPLKTVSAKIMAGAAAVLLLLILFLVMRPQTPQPQPEEQAPSMRIPAKQAEPEAMQIPKMPLEEKGAPLPSGETAEALPNPNQPEAVPVPTADQPLPAETAPPAKAPALEQQQPVAPTAETPVKQLPEGPRPIPAAVTPGTESTPGDRRERVTASPHANQPRTLKRISVQNTDNGPTIHIQADGPIDAHQSFLLPDPHRLVIDLAGKWEKPGFYAMAVEHDLIRSVRVWKHDKKLRIVCDLQSGLGREPVFKTASDGLVAELGATPP
ncbi:MAG: AMIN domain-containing protein [Thermodesulfobacteriota bacterium]